MGKGKENAKKILNHAARRDKSKEPEKKEKDTPAIKGCHTSRWLVDCLLKTKAPALDEDGVKLSCTNPICPYAETQLLHNQCFEAQTQFMMEMMSKCGSARNWPQDQLRANAWAKKGMSITQKSLRCPCGKGVQSLDESVNIKRGYIAKAEEEKKEKKLKKKESKLPCLDPTWGKDKDQQVQLEIQLSREEWAEETARAQAERKAKREAEKDADFDTLPKTFGRRKSRSRGRCRTFSTASAQSSKSVEDSFRSLTPVSTGKGEGEKQSTPHHSVSKFSWATHQASHASNASTPRAAETESTTLVESADNDSFLPETPPESVTPKKAWSGGIEMRALLLKLCKDMKGLSEEEEKTINGRFNGVLVKDNASGCIHTMYGVCRHLSPAVAWIEVNEAMERTKPDIARGYRVTMEEFYAIYYRCRLDHPLDPIVFDEDATMLPLENLELISV